MWADNCLMYQIYPIGFCGAPKINDGTEGHLFGKIEDIIPHLKQMRVNAVMLNPVIKSSTHGYDTVDFFTVDNRLGTEDEFRALVTAMHENGIRVVYDGVFNHVGREFAPFKDVREKRGQSRYCKWFYINFDGNSKYNDGFSYRDWQGCQELVKLNLDEPEVQKYIFDAVDYWINFYGIDGLRLDAANLLTDRFLEKLKAHISSVKADFPLIGEQVHIFEQTETVRNGLLDSLTNYECYKSILFSVNQLDLSDIAYTISHVFSDRAFAGKPMLNFLDNHDVTRIATNLSDGRDIELVYALLFALPGFPCIYYGSEFSVFGDKRKSDYALRPQYDAINKSDTRIQRLITALADLRQSYNGAAFGEYKSIYINNYVFVMSRGDIIYGFNIMDVQANVKTENLDITIPPHGFTVQKSGKTILQSGR